MLFIKKKCKAEQVCGFSYILLRDRFLLLSLKKWIHLYGNVFEICWNPNQVYKSIISIILQESFFLEHMVFIKKIEICLGVWSMLCISWGKYGDEKELSYWRLLSDFPNATSVRLFSMTGPCSSWVYSLSTYRHLKYNAEMAVI